VGVFFDIYAAHVDEGVGVARIGKFVRVARILRSLRVLRIMKLRQLAYAVVERIRSEYISIVGGLVTNIAGLMAINHFIACLWFAVGTSTGYPNWVSANNLWESDWFLQYLVSLHWALTQFTPASMFVGPKNLSERAFNVVVLLFAMCVFSSFVSSITSAMTRLRTLRAHQVNQFYMLRRFLIENNISKDLSARITRYIDLMLTIHKQKLDRNKIELLSLLSGPLHVALQRELFEPSLRLNSYFVKYSEASRPAMNQLCFLAVQKYSISKGDRLFDFGVECHDMLILTHGTLCYRRAKGIKSVRRTSSIPVGCSCCEAVLWVPWVTRGTMKAVIESDVVALSSAKFRQVTTSHPDALCNAHEYAQDFLYALKREARENLNVWDVAVEILNANSRDESELRKFSDGELHVDYQMEAEMMNSSSSSNEDGSVFNPPVYSHGDHSFPSERMRSSNRHSTM